MAFSIRPDRPIHPTTLAIVRRVASAAAACDVRFMIVGATARDIVLEHVYGIAPGRATRDVDVAFAIERWEEFDRLKDRLCESGEFERIANRAHRLVHRPGKQPGTRLGVDLDIIPFGEIAGHDAVVAWPPDLAVLMNVAGYAEAMASACVVELAPDLAVRVASLPGLALMKLFAWSDRWAANTKDGEDLAQLLRDYERAGIQDRIYADECSELLDEVDFDPVLAGAWLLGIDAGRIGARATIERALEILADERTFERLVTVMSRSVAARPDPFDYAGRLLGLFRRGLRSSFRS